MTKKYRVKELGNDKWRKQEHNSNADAEAAAIAEALRTGKTIIVQVVDDKKSGGRRR